MRRLLLLPLLAAGSLAAQAQAPRPPAPTPPFDPNATHRSVQGLALWPELQGELALPNGDYLLLALRGERYLHNGTQRSRPLGFDMRRVRLAYEHFVSAAWSYGATVQLAGGGGGTVVVPAVLLRHRSPVFQGITFGQRLSLEHSFGGNGFMPLGSGPGGQTWARLRVDLEKLLPLGNDAATGPALRPRLSYEASTHLRFQKADADPDERTIQYTSLRGEVGVRLSSRFDFTPWFAYQTGYLIGLPQYDKNGVQTDGGRTNQVYPTLGLDVRFTLLPAGTKADQHQLPTQH